MRYTIFILAFFINLQYGASQVPRQYDFTKVVYEMSYQLDSLDKASEKSERMELLFNDSISIFQSIGKGLKDSLKKLKKSDKEIASDASFKSFSRMRVHYTINRIGNDFWVVDTYSYGGIKSDGYQLYEEKLDPHWEILNETDSLFGYLVQKATTTFGGRNWIAWFAPDIPVDAGPYKFYGLPGLIMKVHDQNLYWQFSVQSITPHLNRDIVHRDEVNKDIILTDKLSFFKNRAYYLKNRTAIDELSGNIIVTSPEIRQRAVEDDKIYEAKNNNWIERYP